jgi:hypothetical protein
MTLDEQTRPVFNSEGIHRLLAEGGGEDLNDDERALLVAMIGVDTATGRELSEEERAALDKLKAQVGDYDAEGLAEAVKHMVTSQPRESRKLEWPTLGRKQRK